MEHGAGSGGAGLGLTPIAAFVRIKPLDADVGGGTATTKRVASWDEHAGTIDMEVGGRGVKSFDFPGAGGTLPPEAAQEHVYGAIAAPLVEQFCAGFDVDLISYGQTGSGKTFTMFGPPHSMAEAAALQSRSGAGTGISGEAILRPEHGFLLRAGLDSLAAVAALRARGCKAVLHGSMIEMSIQSFTDQNCKDLLKDLAVCFVDEQYHLQGASQMELRCAADVVHLAAAVETRLTRGTKMNDTSSRRYCTVCPEPLFALRMTLAPAATASQCSSSLCWRAVLCARAGYSSLT
jgi:hypothetical protein